MTETSRTHPCIITECHPQTFKASWLLYLTPSVKLQTEFFHTLYLCIPFESHNNNYFSIQHSPTGF